MTVSGEIRRVRSTTLERARVIMGLELTFGDMSRIMFII